ncbi:MAG: hypothetical protein H7339_04185 [Arcicella sp.]|nr:hypothetical protein [Arcicella sp.]
MTTTTENLWPEFELEILTVSPKRILLEQASFLMQATKNILEADVTTFSHKGGEIDHNFFLIAPQLDGYRYSLLFVRQNGLIMYPSTLYFENQAFLIETEGILLQELRRIFSEQRTKNIISSLLAQSKDNKNSVN